jgi:hypothetical protein
MRRFIFSLFICVSVLATEPIDFCWETKNVFFDCFKLLGAGNSLYIEQTSKAGHWLRLSQSVMDYFGIRGKLKVYWRVDGILSQTANPGIEMDYGKRQIKVPDKVDEYSYLKTLLEILGKKTDLKKILSSLPDYGAPSISMDGERLVYRVWQDGKVFVVVGDLEGQIIWKWGVPLKKGEIPIDPSISLSGKIACFLYEPKETIYKLYIKDLDKNRFYRHIIPVPNFEHYDLYNTPFVYPSDKFVLCGTAHYYLKSDIEPCYVKLYFYKPDKLVFKFPFILRGSLNFLWSPDQEKLLIALEKRRDEWFKYYEDLWVVDVPKKKVYRFKLLPAHYSFVWNNDSSGIFLATKGKKKGEIFYLPIKAKKAIKLHKCNEGLEIFSLQNDGTLLLKKGTTKLLFFAKGKAEREIKALFQRYIENPPASPGRCSCVELFSWGCYNIVGPFPTNCIELGIIDEPIYTKHQIFVYPNHLVGDIIKINKALLSVREWQRLREILAKNTSIYFDIHPAKGIAMLNSLNGGCGKLALFPLSE